MGGEREALLLVGEVELIGREVESGVEVGED